MAECSICESYTKFEGGLCIKCYHEKNDGGKAAPVKIELLEHNGLSNKDYNFRYGMIWVETMMLIQWVN